uniref:Uncharacterized protein n=1 Tax=Geladintestivirus 2 TaxID=3233134 RepID=A0AAU8MKG7_9CAUD
MDEIISTITNTAMESFDFGFCIVTNIATYIVIKAITEYKSSHNKTPKIDTWIKRLILLLVITISSIIYCITGSNIKLIFNSSILAPVFWSWILKPICNKLCIGYNHNTNGELY